MSRWVPTTQKAKTGTLRDSLFGLSPCCSGPSATNVFSCLVLQQKLPLNAGGKTVEPIITCGSHWLLRNQCLRGQGQFQQIEKMCQFQPEHLKKSLKRRERRTLGNLYQLQRASKEPPKNHRVGLQRMVFRHRWSFFHGILCGLCTLPNWPEAKTAPPMP